MRVLDRDESARALHTGPETVAKTPAFIGAAGISDVMSIATGAWC